MDDLLTPPPWTRQELLAFRSLVEGLGRLVFSAGEDGRVERLNPRWGDYTGLDPSARAEWLWQVAVHPADRPTLLERWAAAVQEGRPFQAEVRLRRSDGAYRWHLARALPLREAEGPACSWLGTCTEVHELAPLQAGWRAEVEERAGLLARLDRTAGLGPGPGPGPRGERPAWPSRVGGRGEGVAPWASRPLAYLAGEQELARAAPSRPGAPPTAEGLDLLLVAMAEACPDLLVA